MKFELRHLSYNVSDLNASKDFYLNKLGFELLNGNDAAARKAVNRVA